MTVFISGRSVEEYIIHDIEMVVKKLGYGANSVVCAKNGKQMFFHLCYPDDRSACLVYSSYGLPGSTIMESADGEGVCAASKGHIFKGLISDMLRFFDEKAPSFDTAQTLEAMRVRDAVLKSTVVPGEIIKF